MLFGIAGGGVPLTVSAPGVPDAAGHFAFSVVGPDGGALYLVHLDLTTSGGGVPASFSWKAFNPQPEPPALGPGAGAVGFDFNFTGLSDAFLKMQVFDAQGQALAFNVVPEAPTWPLVLLGASLLLMTGRSRLLGAPGGRQRG